MCNIGGIRPAKATDEKLHVGQAATNPEPKTDLAFLPIRQIKRHLHRPARIQPRAGFAGKTLALQGGRLCQVSVAADEFFPVARDCAGGFVYVQEHDAVGELGVVIIARQQSSGLDIHLGLDVQKVFMAQVPQNPFRVAGDGQTTRTTGNIAQFQH